MGDLRPIPGARLAARLDAVALRPSRGDNWSAVNITPAERLARVTIGLAAVIAGAFLLASTGSALAVVLEALLIAAGLDLAVTGTLGHCPLYAKLGHLPRSLREAP